MWILDSESDVLQGKKYWLKPGQEYSMGRSPQSRIELSRFKSISKKHITIKLGPVPKGSAENVDARSTITIEDHASTFGTWLNGAEIKNASVEVTSVDNVLKLAKMPASMRLRWQPIVLTNANMDPAKLEQLTDKLEPFEIKIVQEYSDKTTYVVISKLNIFPRSGEINRCTAKVLTGLIQQKHIVTDLFGDALYSSLTTIGEVLDPDLLPDPIEFLPSSEDCPADVFRQNVARAEIFKNLTFIFLDQGQYDDLVAPINAGLGKAVIHDLNVDNVENLVANASNKGQAVLIKRNVDSDTLCIAAAKRLGCDVITTGAILAPVLRVDRSLLLKPIGPSTQNLSVPDSMQDSDTFVVANGVERPSLQTNTTNEVDITFSAPVVKKLKSRPREADTQVDLFADFLASAPKQSTQKSPRKTSTPRSSFEDHDIFSEFTTQKSMAAPPLSVSEQVIEEDEEDEDFAPAATEMRKRLEAAGARSTISDGEQETVAGKTFKSKTKGKKRPATEDDEVIQAARERKRVALEESTKAAEELAAAVKDHAHLKSLGDVEVFHVDMTVRPSIREDRSARWNPHWNGRKNFKKFRKAKHSYSVGVGREMIQLVEHKGKSAASQEFFFPPTSRGSGRQSQTNAQKVESKEHSFDDLAMDDVLTGSGSTKRSTHSSKTSQRTSVRSSGRSSKRSLFINDDSSDNDLGFD